MTEEKKNVKLRVVVDDDVALGHYVNFANILHNPTEFVIDFGRVVPGKEEAKILTRVITTPLHAKQILHALQNNVAIYEKNFGEIRTVPADPGAPGASGGVN